MLSKELFIKVIENVKAAFKYQNDLNDFYRSHGADGYIFHPDCSESVVSLLEYIFEDKDEWISYFMFELEFGEKWYPGTITDKNNNDIPLSTSEELYIFLTNNR